MLNSLKKITKNSKRKGRGIGSKKGGHTVGRGTKGARSRSGFKSPRKGFEGGQMPLSRRLPKLKGFTRSYFKKKKNKFEFSMDDISNFFNEGETISLKVLKEKGLVSNKTRAAIIKVLGNGTLDKKVNLNGVEYTESAKAQIIKKGGKVR